MSVYIKNERITKFPAGFSNMETHSNKNNPFIRWSKQQK